MAKKVSIPSAWEVPSALQRQVSEIAGSQRALVEGGHLLVILHELPTASGGAERNIRMFWRTPDGTWKSDSMGPGINSVHSHLVEYAKRVEQLEQQLARANSSDDYFMLRREASPIRRAAHNMYATLQRACEVCPDDYELASCRNWAGTIERALELVYEEGQHGLEYAMAIQTEAQTQASHRLNMLAAIFLPIATAAAIFGMNLNSGLEHAYEPWLFWGVLVIGVLIGLSVQACITARSPRRRPGERTPSDFKPERYS
ncbi:MAG: magnesium transporter CorA family protein [Planctomycetes bacterium]|nr:magnesium transporter CorA family protein [Planctomycetota bacterium]